ncbi:MAG: choice-of-anchor J domain-containing protein, partial [Prevotella sp.]|nr:choice-of-anchor J domain-containing protein [Prevotella sp.]
ATRHGENRYENWRSHSVDLSAYAGQSVWIAFHHQDYDEYEIWIDDVALTSGAKDGERHLEYYKVLCESLDHEPIFNANTVNPFCQLVTDELVEGELYICKVAAVYSTGMSDYAECVWQYESCENYAGTLNGVTVDGNTISWDYPGGGPVPPTPGEGDAFSVDFEAGMPAGWNVIDGNNDGWTWCLTSNIPSTWTYYAGMDLDWYHGGTNAICSGSYINGVGALNPDEYLVSPQVNLAAGSQLSFWVAATDPSYAADHFGVFISDNGTSDWTSVQEWTLTGKKSGMAGAATSREGKGMRIGNWYNYTVDLSAFAGQKYIAFRHFNCYDQYIMCLDDIELTSGAKSNHAAPADFNRDGWLTYDYTGAYYNAIGLTSYAEFSYGNMHPASQMAAYNGQSLTKVSLVPFCNMTGSIDIYQGGTTAPETLVYTQPISLTGVGDAATYVDVNLTTPVVINGSQSLWVIITASTYDTYPAAMTEFQGDVNGSWLYLEGYDWMSVGDAGIEGTWMVKAYVEEGTTPPTPPTPGEGILGAMIFVDSEWEAFVPVPTNTYTYEGEGSEVCVRIVYNGDNELPSNNTYYAMSCEECETIVPGPGTCEPGAPIHSELVDANHIKVWWG